MRLFLIIIYFAFELYLLVSFADEFGFLALLGEIIISGILGFGILASQHEAMFGSLRDMAMGRGSMGGFITRSFFRFIGGLLLIIPGILSDIFGIVFFIISLLFKASGTYSNQTYSNKNAESRHFDDDVIDVEVIEESDKKIR